MRPARRPVQRHPAARLLAVDACGHLAHVPRSRWVDLLRAGDLVVANDAATLPASLHGIHRRSGAGVEVRLAGRRSLARDDVRAFTAVVFGPGDYRTPTEHRLPPPQLAPGDRVDLGTLAATIDAMLDHPRLVRLRFHGSPDRVWAGIARHGRPVQYAHVPVPLAIWDAWTPIAGMPVAFEPPSAGFVLDWDTLHRMRGRGIGFATVTLAAGLSSTGDEALDARLPFPEAFRIPETTALRIGRTRARGGRIVAVGTTVVRALEHAAIGGDGVRAGDGVADRRVDAGSTLRVVDVILSGTHEPGSRHYELLQAFQDAGTLARVSEALERHGYRTHEFSDSVLIENRRRAAAIPLVGERRPAPCAA